MKKETTPAYYAIVPADVRYSVACCMGAKLLYGEITALCNKEGYCWANNQYFADLYYKDTNTISRWIKELVEAGFITAELSRKEGNVRRLYLSTKMPEAIHKIASTPHHKNVVTPIHKNGEHNNTVLNSTVSNSTSNEGTASPEEIIKQKKTKFFSALNSYKKKNKGKLPDLLYDKFFSYWCETNEVTGSTKMRWEHEKGFDFGRRLATFWARTNNEERSEMWKLQELQVPEVAPGQLNFGDMLKMEKTLWDTPNNPNEENQ